MTLGPGGLVLRRPAFRRLFIAHAISRAGDAFNTVALVVLVFGLTGSGLGVAGTVAFEVAPILLVGPIAGLAADRLPRRTLMVGADILRAALAALLAVSHSSVGLAYGVAFGLSTGSVFFNPAAASLVPEVVDDEELVAANSALWTVAVVAQVVFAPLAGALIAGVGVGAAFGLNALSFVASAAVLVGLRAGRTPAAAIGARSWQGISEGLSVVRSSPLLSRLAIVQPLAALSAGATGGLLVVLAEERLAVGAPGFGVLLAAIGGGAVAGPLVLGRFVRPGARRWLYGPLVLRGGVDLGLAWTTSAAAAGGALAAYGVGTSTGTVAFQSTVQTEVASERRGRTFALFDLLWNSARLVSLGLGGVLADAAGIRAVYLLGGALLLAAAAVGFTGPARADRSSRA
ncbi:MAG: MFS transporter [Acidimicrobiia bacterium]